MSGFDLVFALFGLVLGLAITEILAGFSRVMKMRGKVHVGWLVPLLGLLVLLDLTTFWMQAFSLRNLVPANLFSLFVVLAIVGAYYLVATLVFPDDPDAWPDFDIYYDQYNRRILGGMLIVNIMSMVASSVALLAGPEAAVEAAGAQPVGELTTILAVAPIALILLLIYVRSRRANIAILLVLIADFLAMALTDVLGI